MTDDMKATVVTMAYVKMLRAMRGRYFKKLPPRKGKILQNCIKFYDTSIELNTGVYPMMLIGLDCYSSDWLQKTFGSDIPPFSVITSEKVLNIIKRQMPESVKFGNTDQVADSIMHSIRKLDRKTAIELIESDIVCGNNKILKDTLLGRLQWAKTSTVE